jgi:hypothetical protein
MKLKVTNQRCKTRRDIRQDFEAIKLQITRQNPKSINMFYLIIFFTLIAPFS